MKLNGIHPIIEALEKNAQGTIYIAQQHHLLETIQKYSQKNNCILKICTQKEIKAKGGRQGILFYTNLANTLYVKNLSKWLSERADIPLGILILDHIQDPQNYGTILRSSSLFGVGLVIIPERRMAPENEVCGRSAAGALHVMPRCRVSNLRYAIDILKQHDIWVYALDMDGELLSRARIPHRCAFILGGEHKGVSKILRTHSDKIVSVPTNKTLDSLNVSSTATIACYEYYTQHVTRERPYYGCIENASHELL